MNLWHVAGEELVELRSKPLDSEDRLENWLANDPSLLGIDILIIGRQVVTDHAGRIDLLGLDRDANCVIIELKRGRTPRDVVAQLLDYASWVQHLGFDDLDAICQGFRHDGIAQAYADLFGDSLPDIVNSEHSLFLVASELDDSSERIMGYLSETHGVGINAVFFTCFDTPAGEVVGRAWLQDPEDVTERSASGKRPPWSGYWFVNVGEGPHRNWDDNRRYNFLGAGQGTKYSKSLKKLTPRSKVFAYMKGRGYVGFGEVASKAIPIKDYVPKDHERPLLELDLRAPNPGKNVEDLEMCDWVVPINWIKTFSREEARSFKGVFANQNIVCKLRHSPTVEFLEGEFELET
ncbi:MAG: DUF91 domain-containing protein [Planctomycetes bacterium]|nr:DUF91 domain-containing protein [Planctomycetota bacterium]